MRCITLYPPNYEALSEDIIGDVKQRVGSLHQISVFGNRSNGMRARQLIPGVQVRQSGRSHTVLFAQNKKKGNNAESIRLERLRKNQERYRMRQRKFKEDLENGYQHLREEIAVMRTQLGNLPIEVKVPLTLWSAATDYFRYFQCGVHTRKETSAAQIGFLQSAMTPDIVADTLCGVATRHGKP